MDLTDQVFGQWKALYYSGNGKWFCQCSCGRTTKDIFTAALTHNRTEICRLCANEKQNKPKMK